MRGQQKGNLDETLTDAQEAIDFRCYSPLVTVRFKCLVSRATEMPAQ